MNGSAEGLFAGLWLQTGWQGCRNSLPHPMSGHPFAALAVLTRVLAGPRCRLRRGLMWAAVAFFFVEQNSALDFRLASVGEPSSQTSAWAQAVGSGWAANVSSRSCPCSLLPLPAPGEGRDALVPSGYETTWGSVHRKRFWSWTRGLERLRWQTHDLAKWAMINVYGVLDRRMLAAACLPFCSAYSNIVWISLSSAGNLCLCQPMKHIFRISPRLGYRNTVCNWFQLKPSPDPSDLPLSENQQVKGELFCYCFAPPSFWGCLATSSCYFIMWQSLVLLKASFLSLSCLTGLEDVVAIMIPEPKGREIVSLLERNITVMMYITIGTRNLQKYVSRTSVVFVSISFIVLMIISLAWLVFYYIQRFRYANARDRNQVSSAGMAVCVTNKSPWDSA